MVTRIDYYCFIRLDDNRIDRYIKDLHETLNTSENYNEISWTFINVVNNLEDGYFDIFLDEDRELTIFGIHIDTVNEEVGNILLGIK